MELTRSNAHSRAVGGLAELHTTSPSVMSTNLKSSVLSSTAICELAIAACAGDWNSFWTTWECNPRTFTLASPYANAALQLLDWLACECREAMRFRLDEDIWPTATYSSLSGVGISVVVCMSADDGRRLLKAITGPLIGGVDRISIVRAYDVDNDNAEVTSGKAVAYLKDVFAAITHWEQHRLLMISY